MVDTVAEDIATSAPDVKTSDFSHITKVHERISRLNLESGPPKVIADFDQLLKTRDELQSQMPIKEDDVEKAMHGLRERGMIDRVFDNVIGRIREETRFFQDLEELGIFEYVVLGIGEVPRKDIKEVKVGVGDSGYGGAWYPLPRKIEVNADPKKIGRWGILNSLACGGQLPTGTQKLIHEIMHSVQYPGGLIDKFVQFFFGARYRELAEAQAHRFSDDPIDLVDRNDLVKEILRAKNSKGEAIYPGFRVDRLESALKAIEQLDALGYSALDIVESFEGVSWDQRTMTYPRIEEEINFERKHLGLTDDEDYHNLIRAHILDKQIERLVVKKITQEELLKVVEG